MRVCIGNGSIENIVHKMFYDICVKQYHSRYIWISGKMIVIVYAFQDFLFHLISFFLEMLEIWKI